MVVQINKIPNNLFSTVTKVRDIREAYFIDRKELKRGEPDVMLASPLGLRNRVTRGDLVKNYCMPDGKKIKILHWKYRQKYIVVSNDNVRMYAFKIPKNTKITFVSPNNNKVGTGVYILFPIGSNGEAIRTKPLKIDEKMFNRMFRVDNKPNVKMQKVAEEISNSSIKDSNNSSKSKTNKGLVVIKRIVRPDNGKIVGFVVTNGRVEKNCSVGQVMDMCRLKQIQNITIVNDGEKEHLRGVGIRLNNLPSIHTVI